MKGKELRETVGLIAVVAGLVFVGMEVRQNNQLAQAAAYQAMGEGLGDFWLEFATDDVTADLFWQTTMATMTAEDLAAMPDSHRHRLWLSWVSSLRTLEATWRQVELGLLDEQAFGYFGNNSPALAGVASQNLQLIWPDVKAFMSPDFAEFMESQWQVEG